MKIHIDWLFTVGEMKRGWLYTVVTVLLCLRDEGRGSFTPSA